MNRPPLSQDGRAAEGRWQGALTGLAFLAWFSGCARFEPRPLSAPARLEAFEQRSLGDAGLARFLGTNGLPPLPDNAWDLDRLVLAAFYFHPDMEVARARWHAAIAGKATAAQRPNPSLAFTPRLNASSLGTGLTPWILGGVLDIPVETMGKRKYRVAQAQHLDQMARWDLASTAWFVRGRVRASLLELQGAEETARLVRAQAEALGRTAGLVELQWEAGAVSPVEVTTARVAHWNAQLAFQEAERRAVDARAQLAEALAVPRRGIEGARFVLADFDAFPTNLVSADLQRQAVLNRADVLSALAEYAAAESALQVQIARQYPDLHLRPGYEMDQNENKWQLGLSFDLPLLHQNQGPIAEAEAKRAAVAAKFNTVQARAIGEIERAAAVYGAAADQAATAGRMLASLDQRASAMTRLYDAGEVDQLVVTSARAEYLNGAVGHLQACLEAQRSLAALEQAVQVPLLLPLPVERLETAARPLDPPRTP